MTEPSIGHRATLALLVAHHREFLRYVERRVGDAALAEEILQEVFVRSVARLDAIRDTAIGWFYRALRNAIIDHRRRRSVAERGLERYASEVQGGQACARGAGARSPCGCVTELAGELEPTYAEALRTVVLGGVAVKDYAERAGISPNNASVRVFRARQALRARVLRSCGACARNGCADCTCGSARRR